MPAGRALDRDFDRIRDHQQSYSRDMSDHAGRLLLAPRDPFLAPDLADLYATLAACGFTGDPLPGQKGAFGVGRRFFELVIFAGCSVQVDVNPPTDSGAPFCHIRIAGPYRTPRFAHGRNTRPPRCPSCRAPLRHWRLDSEPGYGGTLTCRTCGGSAPPWEWDWKRSAGYGRLFVAVEEVFPGEAEPTPALMQSLSDVIPGFAWRHFFVQDA